MAGPLTRKDLKELEERIDARGDSLETRMDGLDKRMDGLDTRMGGFEKRYATKVELHEMEARLTYQIAHSANAVMERMEARMGHHMARWSNVIIERVAELIKPVDDKASQALSEARGVGLALEEHSGDPDAHSG